MFTLRNRQLFGISTLRLRTQTPHAFVCTLTHHIKTRCAEELHHEPSPPRTGHSGRFSIRHHTSIRFLPHAMPRAPHSLDREVRGINHDEIGRITGGKKP